MDKLKGKLRDISLRNALLLVSMITLSIVGVLSIISILKTSDVRQKILDTRSIIVTDYRIESSFEDVKGFHVSPEEYSYGKLTVRNHCSVRLQFWGIYPLWDIGLFASYK